MESIRDNNALTQEVNTARSIHSLNQKFAHTVKSLLHTLRVIKTKSKGLEKEFGELLEDVIERIHALSSNLLATDMDELLQSESHVGKPQKLMPAISKILKLIENEPGFDASHSIALKVDQNFNREATFSRVDSLYLLLSTLINNSIEAIPKGGEIQVTLLSETDLIYINVEDNGPGIPSLIKEKVWSEGFSTKSTRGRGIGLSAVKLAIDRLGGNVTYFKSSLGGAGFKLVIPGS